MLNEEEDLLDFRDGLLTTPLILAQANDVIPLILTFFLPSRSVGRAESHRVLLIRGSPTLSLLLCVRPSVPCAMLSSLKWDSS